MFLFYFFPLTFDMTIKPYNNRFPFAFFWFINFNKWKNCWINPVIGLWMWSKCVNSWIAFFVKNNAD